MLTPYQVYRIKLSSGTWVDGKYLGERHYETRRSPVNYYQIRSRAKTHYLFENLASGRTIEIKSLAKVRGY